MEQEDHKRLIQEIDHLRETLAQKEQELKDLKIDNLLLNTLFNGVSEEIMVLDQDFNIKDVNRVFLERYGLGKKDVLGKKCYEIKEKFGSPCNMNDNSCPLEYAKKTGEMVEMTHSRSAPGGEKKELALVMFPLISGDEGVEYFIEITRDLTDYNALIRKLEASQKRFRSILDTATNGILSIDENHKIILFNNAAQRIFGYSREEVLGKDLGILIPQKYGDHQMYVRRFLEKRESNIVGDTISLTALHKNGREFPIELSLSFLEMDDGITFTGIIRDVTDRQKLEQKLLQSERLAAVGKAVAHVSHEIKNPLMIIGGFSGQIKNSLTDEKDMQKIDMILEEVRRLERLALNLGDFVKAHRLVKRLADINSVIKDVQKIMAGVYPPEKYNFTEFLSLEVGEISCDPDKLKQVFINIISNGFEAMPYGGTITVATERIPMGIEIRISDEGIGISDEDLQHIFEPFYTTRESGSGLGLSISYKLIEAHDGEISAINREGKGATFIIRLPV